MDSGAWQATYSSQGHRESAMTESTHTYTRIYIHIYVFFFRFISLIGYYKILTLVACATQQVLVVYLFHVVFNLLIPIS